MRTAVIAVVAGGGALVDGRAGGVDTAARFLKLVYPEYSHANRHREECVDLNNCDR